MSDSDGKYPSAPVPPKVKTPPSSSSSSTSTSHRGRSLHPRSDSNDISADEDENIRPPFHKLRRCRTRGSPPPPIASSSRIYPHIDLPPKLKPVGDFRYETASGGETPEPRSPSPDPLNIGNMLIYAFQEEPQTLKQALKTADHEKWLVASKKEYDNLIEMGTWKLVSLPRDKRPIKCRWRYVIKANGRFKARLVAKGFTQVHGIDYKETFSPVSRYESIWYILAHAALLDWEIKAMDVKTAFLYGELKEEIYMEQPEGFVVKRQEKKVCKLIKSIYGLKQAGQVWYELMADTLRRKLGFEWIHSDAGVYVLRQRGGNQTEIILILYVDDLLLMGNDLSMINKIKKKLGEAYHMKDLGATQSYLGIRITRDHAHLCIWIDQEAYIDSALSQFCLMDANNTKTPLPAGVHLTKSETPSSTNLRTKYQQLIGTLLYAALGTRPDIAFAVTQLSQFNSDPTEEHLRYAKYVLRRYLKGTKSLQVCYDRSLNAGLIGYSDSDWGKNKDDCHSTSGQVFTLANGVISWASQRQKTVALSVGESEYMELAATGRQCAWLRGFSAEIGFPFTQATMICVGDSCQDEGNQGTRPRTPLPLLRLHPQGRAPALPVSWV